MHIRQLPMFAASALVVVCSLPLQAQQLRPAYGANAEEIPAPPEIQPLVPPPPPTPDQPPQVPRTVAPQPSWQQGAQKPMLLHGPIVIARSNSQQKALVYQKISPAPAYRVTYHDHHRFQRPCCELTKMIIAIPDPLRPGCVAEICVTAPACVKGQPRVDDSAGFAGRGVVTLCWPNGHMVRVVFKKLAPHLLVHTYPV